MLGGTAFRVLSLPLSTFFICGASRALRRTGFGKPTGYDRLRDSLKIEALGSGSERF